VRTIVGVPTSITAFVGRTPQGPVDEPTLVGDYGEFTRTFGDLHRGYPLGYAVSDFFMNGGSLALIVRIWKSQATPPASSSSGNARVALDPDPQGLEVEAANPGTWADGYLVSVNRNGIDDLPDDVAAGLNTNKAALFNLTIAQGTPEKPNVLETITNVSVEADSVRRLDRVLEQESALLRVARLGPLDLTAPVKLDTAGEPLPGNPLLQEPLASGDDGAELTLSTDFIGDEDDQTGMYALKKTDVFNILCIPPDGRSGTGRENVLAAVWQRAATFCLEERAFLIIDPDEAWGNNAPTAAAQAIAGQQTLAITGPEGRNAALYFPRVIKADPLLEGRPDVFAPCGIIAGIMSSTDATRGVWKAPAGVDAALSGIQGLQANLSDKDSGQLNPLGINALRNFRVYGNVVWGARTLRGADQMSDDYKYVPVRRLVLYIEESLFRGTQWAVFEPNDEPLWAQLRLNIGAFMHDLFRQGAFQGQSPKDAYFVKCDSTTTTQSDINKGIVNIMVGFAPLKPAEFVVIYIQQMAGNIAT
jgi:phage tail sheath protein FI